MLEILGVVIASSVCLVVIVGSLTICFHFILHIVDELKTRRDN